MRATSGSVEYTSESNASESKKDPELKLAKSLSSNEFSSTLTTNLRNIMSRQEKNYLASSMHLLHSKIFPQLHEKQQYEKKTMYSRVRHTDSMKTLQRPQNSYFLIKPKSKVHTVNYKKIYKNIDLKNARERNQTMKTLHSYMPRPTTSILAATVKPGNKSTSYIYISSWEEDGNP